MYFPRDNGGLRGVGINRDAPGAVNFPLIAA